MSIIRGIGGLILWIGHGMLGIFAIIPGILRVIPVSLGIILSIGALIRRIGD